MQPVFNVSKWIAIERIPGLLAPSYEKAARLVIKDYYGIMAAEVISGLKKGRILDMGTGPGFLPIEMVKLNPSLRIVGIDLSRRLIRFAKKNARDAGVADKIRFEVGNASALPFESRSFDRIISTGMLHSLREPVKVFKEIRRLLKPDGAAWIYDPANVSSLLDRTKWLATLTFQDKLFLGLFRAIGLFQPIKSPTRLQMTPIIRAAGFSRFEIEEKGAEIRMILHAGASQDEI